MFMKRRHPFILLASLFCLLPLGFSQTASAQEPQASSAPESDELPDLVNYALEAMKDEKWAEAYKYNARAIEYHGQDGLANYGPRFGEIYYRKGICEIKLGKFEDAEKSFDACYRNFPNTGKRENRFQKMALLKWGEAAMGREDWEGALGKFQKFLAERDGQDKYPEGAFHIGMAICHFRLGRIPEGSEHLRTAIQNKARFRTPDSAIMTGFQELVMVALQKRNEQALLDFIEKNRGELTISPFLMAQYSKLFMKLAADAINEEMDRVAFALYHFVPPTETVIDDLRARIKSMGSRPRVEDGNNAFVLKDLEQNLATLEQERRGKQSVEAIRLAATAYLHERNVNVRGAYAAYLQLESFYPISERREDNLYNLVRTSSVVGTAQDTQRHAETFAKSFPASKHLPTIRRLMLTGLFYDGKYAECISIAEPMLGQLAEGSTERDICLHVLGGSYFYTGEHEKAQKLLDEHFDKYPKSSFALTTAYFRASNQSRLQNWEKAAPLLDEFLKNHPDPATNIYLPFALYERANCHYAQEQFEPAMDKVAAIVKDFPKSNVIDQAYLLRGSIEEFQENKDRAEIAYKSAYETAVEKGHKGVAVEALYALVVLLGQEGSPRLADAMPYIDLYRKEYAADLPNFRTRFAIAQYPALMAANKQEEALESLRTAIIEAAANPESTSIEGLIAFYTDAYLTKHSPEELKEHYYNFPGIKLADTATRALLRVFVIRVFEALAKKTKEEKEKLDAQATVKVVFQQLKTDFVLKDLANSVLLKVGDYLRANTATPREALPYYDEILSRGESEQRLRAMVGRAGALSASSIPADLDKAFTDFETVYKESEEKADRELALYHIVELLMAKQDYVKASEMAQTYLDREKTGFSRYSPQVGLLLAQSFERRKMPDDAIQMYMKVWTANMGNIKVSAPALKGYMELLWARNKNPDNPAVASDRQAAYEGGAKYVELTTGFKAKMSEEELKIWNEIQPLVKKYEDAPGIKSMAEIKAEKEKNQKIRLR